MSQQKWYDTIVEFFAHILTASAIFVIIAIAAAGLSVFIHWLQHVFGLDSIIVGVLKLLEYAIFFIDVILFVVWIAVSGYRALIKELKEDE